MLNQVVSKTLTRPEGYNTTWAEAARRYRQISSALYTGRSSLGLCVLFTWPSDGLKVGYYPDRLDARRSADELAQVLSTLYDHLRRNQERTMETGQPQCRVKISIIAHSMGNDLLQKAIHHVWTRKNQPLLVSPPMSTTTCSMVARPWTGPTVMGSPT